MPQVPRTPNEEEKDDEVVDEAVDESFPATDASSHTPVTGATAEPEETENDKARRKVSDSRSSTTT